MIVSYKQSLRKELKEAKKRIAKLEKRIAELEKIVNFSESDNQSEDVTFAEFKQEFEKSKNLLLSLQETKPVK